MKLDRLLMQMPFNKWTELFLKEYTTSGHTVWYDRIGAKGFITDTDLLTAFLKIMLIEEKGAFTFTSDLVRIFHAWYELNQAYHTNFAPPKLLLLEILQDKYTYAKRRGDWGFVDIRLAADTPAKAYKLINEQRKALEFQLPDFMPEENRKPRELPAVIPPRNRNDE